jgi:hypothetical protein
MESMVCKIAREEQSEYRILKKINMRYEITGF